MGVLNPLKIKFTNKPPASVTEQWEAGKYAKAPHMPFDASRGSHVVPAADEDTIFIDHNDFRLVDDSDFFGLAPRKAVGLKYSGRIFCDEVEKDTDGKPVLLKCRYLADDDATKVKTHIQWVGEKHGVQAEVRMYNSLFKVEEPNDDKWEDDLNPDSEVVLANAMVDPSVFMWNPVSESPFQFERIGFFVVDQDSELASTYKAPGKVPSLKAESNENITIDDFEKVVASAKGSKLVLNLTVALPSSKPKSASDAAGGGRSRKDEQLALAAEKERMKSIPPQEMFKVGTNEGLYKEYDENGIPTVLADGEAVSKSAGKKFKKDWEKQKKLYEGAKK
jgi:glutaminyl-tRNA synthetase